MSRHKSNQRNRTSSNPFAALDRTIQIEDDIDSADENESIMSADEHTHTPSSPVGGNDTTTSSTMRSNPLSRKSQKRQAKKAKRQKFNDSIPRNISLSVEDEEKKEDDEEADPDIYPGEEEDTNSMMDDNDGTASESTTKSNTTATNAANATNPADVGVSHNDITVGTRTLTLLNKHITILDHPSFRPLRVALAPLVASLNTRWSSLANSRDLKRKLRKEHKLAHSTKTEYELAMDQSARNQTQIRAQRLKNLEKLNTLMDGDAIGEAARANAARYRVPDGVAITDGKSDDICMRMITDGKSSQQQQLLLTNGSNDTLTTPSAAAASSSSTAPPVAAKLIHATKCYTCKTPYKQLHHFYDSLCPTCAKLNFSKRELHTDMTGKIVLLTGARIKIGYRILLKLLRCNAFVIATTRFPHDLSTRLRLEYDFKTWKSNVHIYGLDFRNLNVLEEFVKRMYQKYTHLDAIINNACQTVRRPPAYYTHLLESERIEFSDLEKDAQTLLAEHHSFAEATFTGSSGNRLNGGSNLTLKSGETEQPQMKRTNSIMIVEEDDDTEMNGAEEIVASSSKPASTAAVSSSSTRVPPSSSSPLAPPPSKIRSTSEPVSGASTTTAAAPLAATTTAPTSRKRSRRGAMRAAENAAAASSSSTSLITGAASAASGVTFTSAATLAAESTQLSLIASDSLSPEERAQYFPEGERDVNGQQLDLREKNSWTMKLEDVPIGEAAEVMAINALAPFLLNSKLKALMIKGNEDKKLARFIVNVSAMEGKFYRFKSSSHPHTNAAKAALNMMTRTSAQDYVNSMIFMTAVDTGWINDENPLPKAAAIAAKYNFQTPLDEVDAAMRVLDPILTPLKQLSESGNKNKNPRELKPPIPFGYFLKDYEKCEW